MGPSDLLPSSPTLVLLSSRQITSSLSAFLSLGCDAADTCLAVSPGEVGQEAWKKGEEKEKINKVGMQQTGPPQLSSLVLHHSECNTSLPVLTGGVFGRQLLRVLLPLLLQPSPPLQLLLLGGFGHGLQLMLPQ